MKILKEISIMKTLGGKLPVITSILLVLGFAGGIAFVSTLGSARSSKVGDDNAAVQTVSPRNREILNEFSDAFESAAAKVNESVVPIFSEQVTKVENPFGSTNDPLREFFGDDFFKRFFGAPLQDQKQVVHALGSGVIVSKDGYIITNNHVVKDAQKLTVTLAYKKKYTARVVGKDPNTDVAVIKIDAKNLPVASLGNSDQVKVGEWVIAVGNPFQLMHTVTAGIISAKGRASVNLADYEDFIQTDASINPGNSGGALADLDGDVIGINTAIYSPSGGNVGIGFAIPINMAKRVMDQLVATGKVTRGYLGLLPQDVDDNLAKALNLKSTDGSLVGDVTADGPAQKAGIKRGDVITSFNGRNITSSTELRNAVAETVPGSEAKVGLIRDGKQEEVTVKVAERPRDLASRGSKEEEQQQGEESSAKLGLSVQSLTPELAKQLGYENDHGVVVASVTPGSVADDAGIKSGDLIKEVDRKSIRTVQEFTRAVKEIRKGGSVAILVRRGGNTFYAGIQVPS